NLLEALGVLAHLRDLLDDDPLHWRCRNGLRRAMFPASLLRVGADVVAIALAGFARVCRGHRAAARPAVQKSLQDCLRHVPLPCAPMTMALEQLLHLLPLYWIDNRRMFAVVKLGLVTQLARVGGVRQEFVQVGFDKGLAAHLAPFASHPNLGPPTP